MMFAVGRFSMYLDGVCPRRGGRNPAYRRASSGGRVRATLAPFAGGPVRRLVLFALALGLAAAFAGLAAGPAAAKDFSITAVNIDATVRPNGDLRVHESRQYWAWNCGLGSRPYLMYSTITRTRATSGNPKPTTLQAMTLTRAQKRSLLAWSAHFFSSARTAASRAPAVGLALARAAAGNRMRPSTNVSAGRGSTVMITLASGSMATWPQSGPCAQARTWSRVTPAGRWTVTRTWSAGTVA